MNQSDTQIVRNAYRSLREIIARTDDPKQKQALTAACGFMAAALGEEGKLDQKMLELVSNVFGGAGGFTFVPFL